MSEIQNEVLVYIYESSRNLTISSHCFPSWKILINIGRSKLPLVNAWPCLATQNSLSTILTNYVAWHPTFCPWITEWIIQRVRPLASHGECGAAASTATATSRRPFCRSVGQSGRRRFCSSWSDRDVISRRRDRRSRWRSRSRHQSQTTTELYRLQGAIYVCRKYFVSCLL